MTRVDYGCLGATRARVAREALCFAAEDVFGPFAMVGLRVTGADSGTCKRLCKRTCKVSERCGFAAIISMSRYSR